MVMGTDVKELVRLRAHEKEYMYMYTFPLIDKKENRTKVLCSDPRTASARNSRKVHMHGLCDGG